MLAPEGSAAGAAGAGQARVHAARGRAGSWHQARVRDSSYEQAQAARLGERQGAALPTLHGRSAGGSPAVWRERCDNESVSGAPKVFLQLARERPPFGPILGGPSATR